MTKHMELLKIQISILETITVNALYIVVLEFEFSLH